MSEAGYKPSPTSIRSAPPPPPLLCRAIFTAAQTQQPGERPSPVHSRPTGPGTGFPSPHHSPRLADYPVTAGPHRVAAALAVIPGQRVCPLHNERPQGRLPHRGSAGGSSEILDSEPKVGIRTAPSSASIPGQGGPARPSASTALLRQRPSGGAADQPIWSHPQKEQAQQVAADRGPFNPRRSKHQRHNFPGAGINIVHVR